MTDILEPFDELVLRRWPRYRNERLRAWDGADLYLLRTLDELLAEPDAGEGTLVLNDQHGALWLSACKRGPAWSSGDSWLARESALANAKDNDRELPAEHWLWPGERPPAIPARVLIRVPKSVSLLESQLADLSCWLPEGTPVWLAGMEKHLPQELLLSMKRRLGGGRAGYGWKKARRFHWLAPGKALRELPEPARLEVPERGWQLTARAGVFARRHLDIGARLLLEHLPSSFTGKAVDLGCGNGILGLALAADNPEARVTFCDESWLAVATTRDNVEALFGPSHPHTLHHGHGLRELGGWTGPRPRFDLVLLNPPFHREHALDERMARTLLRHAWRHLVPGGELRMVANRHLDYRRALSKMFGQADVLATNAKFVVYRCRRLASEQDVVE